VALIERLMGWQPETFGPKIPVHAGQALLNLWARGDVTGAEAQAGIAAVSGEALRPADVTEAQAIVALVTSIAIGGAQAAQADARARRALLAKKIDDVLLCAEAGMPPFDTPAAVRARLGI
jgi:hypothetical protein